jgi:integrase/recombinase XerD
LLIGNVDLNTGKVNVLHGVRGGAKGGKGRTVFLGKTARRAVWRYLADRDDRDDPDEPLFVGKTNRAFNKDALRQVINALGKKAGVKKCYPHRFRHTFSITYLRSGGDVFTLQMLLGHSSLDMVKRYARVAEIDAERVHRKASPADNWRL